MKSVKKMLSLLLVAMLLVTAIPFAASASELGTPTSFPIKYYVHDVGRYAPTELTNLGLPASVTVNVLNNQPDPSFIKSEALKVCSAETAKAFIAQAAIPNPADFTIGEVEITFTNNEVHYTLPVTLIPTSTVATGAMNAMILEKVGSSYVDNGKTIPVEIVTTTTTNPNTTTVTVTRWKTGAEIKAQYAAPFEGVTVNVDRTYVENNQPYICISTSASSSSSGGSSLGSGSSNNGGSSSNNGGSSSNNGGTGTVAQFKVTFLNVNGVEFYSEYVTANGTIAASADFLNSSVGTREGYEHIGWKANSGSTKTTNVVLTDRINANVTYAPVFRNVTNNSVVIPGGGSSSVSGGNTSGSNSGTNKFPYPVYLNIYKDTLVGSPDKRVEITNGIALDGLVSLDEVKTVVKNYYNAKDSDGIKYDGLYIAAGNWVAEYVADTSKYDSIDSGSMRQTGTVYINVMITNATAKSSAKADSSNPKTGDTIFVPVMVMGVTASALAAAYVFGKKRVAR